MRVVVPLLVMVLAGCRSSAPAPDASAASASAVAASSLSLPTPIPSEARASTRPPLPPPKAGEIVSIPAHAFPFGSTPGDDGRDPTIEPVIKTVNVGAFQIDALPYPNDPSRPPRTGVSRAEAARLCAEVGARLCTETEWEAACKGPDGDLMASGAAWASECDKAPYTCASGYGVRAMGVLREWTAGDIAGRDGEATAPAARGGGRDVRGAHRCARRTRGKGSLEDVTFRCCRGPATPDAIAPIESKPIFRKANLSAAQIAKIFATIPELSRIGPDVQLFEGGDGSYLSRSTASREGVTFTTSPLLYTPEPGAELLVVTGRNKSMSFVVALWVYDDKYRIASYFYMLNEVAPVALAYQPGQRTLYWTTCWMCPGEQGTVSLRDDHHVAIVQQ